MIMKRGTLNLVARLALSSAPLVVAAAAVTTLTACADENDPATWVKRLDDPAQRSAAIKRLGQFFGDDMSKAKNNREAPEVKALLDVAVEPLAKTYATVSLDEKTRKDLIKVLADMRDPRAASAMTKAFNDYEPGKNDEDVKFAAQWSKGLAEEKKLTDQGAIDALWGCFAKFHVSKAKSINLVTDLHDAVLAVSHPTYGAKAVGLLAAPVDANSTESQMDQVQFWQKTACQVIKELKFAPAAKPLVKVLLSPTKGELRGVANAALMTFPKEAEDALVAAIKGTDPELAKLASDVPDKLGTAILADAISWISRPAGRDALLEELGKATDDTNRTVLAQCLTRFPPDARIKDAFFAAYKKIPAGAQLKTPDSPYARPVLVQVAAGFYDPSLTGWVLKEVSSSKGDEATQMQAKGLEAALKLMDKAQLDDVDKMVSKLWTAQEKTLYSAAAEVTKKCDKNASCYVAIFDAPVGSSPADKMKAIKAGRMAATYGNDATRTALLGKVDAVKDGQGRLAVAEAIDFLSPKGDAAAASALDKVVAGDIASGNKSLVADDDAVVKVAQRLRARSMP